MTDENILHRAPLNFANDKQKKLFDELFKLDSLTITIEQNGIYSHLMGCFKVNQHLQYGAEDRIDLIGSNSHVHVEWHRLNFCSISIINGEGVIAFFDNSELLFKIFYKNGALPIEIRHFSGRLIEDSVN